MRRPRPGAAARPYLEEDRLDAEDAADPGASEPVAEDSSVAEPHPEDARSLRASGVGAEDEVPQAPRDQPARTRLLDRLEDVRMGAKDDRGPCVEGHGGERALARIGAERPLHSPMEIHDDHVGSAV